MVRYSHERFECGLFSSTIGSLGIPLKNVTITSKLVEPVHTVSVRHVYWVPEGPDRIQAHFKFPLPSGAAITEFTASYASTTLYGRLDEKHAAHSSYVGALHQGRTTAMLSQARPDILECSLGNLPRGVPVTITTTYIESVSGDSLPNSIRLTVPLTIIPRFVPGGHFSQVNPSYSFAPDYFLDLTCSVVTQYPMTRVACSTPLEVAKDGCTAEISGRMLQLDQDIHIVLHQAQLAKRAPVITSQNATADQDDRELPTEPTVYVEQYVPQEGPWKESSSYAYCAQLTILPPVSPTPQRSELTFLLDRSGSMSGRPLDLLKQAMLVLVKSLPRDCHVNIVSFASWYSPLFDAARKHSPDVEQRCIRYIDSFGADGGTNLHPALQHVLTAPHVEGYSRQVVLVTDGAVSNVQEVVDLVMAHRDRARLFSLGVGSGASTALCEGVAAAGRGSADFVADGDDLAGKVVQLLKRATCGALHDVRVTPLGAGPEGTIGSYMQLPSQLQPAFADRRYYAYLLTNHVPTHVEVANTSPSSAGPQVVKVACRAPVPGRKLHQLAVKAALREWELGVLDFTRDSLAVRDTRAERAKMVRLSREYSVACSDTAWVLVAPDGVDFRHSLITVQVPQQVPRGQSSSGAFEQSSRPSFFTSQGGLFGSHSQAAFGCGAPPGSNLGSVSFGCASGGPLGGGFGGVSGAGGSTPAFGSAAASQSFGQFGGSGVFGARVDDASATSGAFGALGQAAFPPSGAFGFAARPTAEPVAAGGFGSAAPFSQASGQASGQERGQAQFATPVAVFGAGSAQAHVASGAFGSLASAVAPFGSSQVQASQTAFGAGASTPSFGGVNQAIPSPPFGSLTPAFGGFAGGSGGSGATTTTAMFSGPPAASSGGALAQGVVGGGVGGAFGSISGTAPPTGDQSHGQPAGWVRVTIDGLLRQQQFLGGFDASEELCRAVTGKPLGEVLQRARALPGFASLKDGDVMSVLVVAYFEKHFLGQVAVWQMALSKVEALVEGLDEKVAAVLAADVLV